MVFAALVSRGHLVTAYDSFRDMAYSHGILRGELGKDPTLPGYAAWYPAGQPMVWAAISRLTGVPVLAALVPPGAVYTALAEPPMWAWLPGPLFTGLVTLVIARRVVGSCEGHLRMWYDRNQGTQPAAA